MPLINEELEKNKKRPARLSQRGCLRLCAGLAVFACGLCYALMWLFAHKDGAWAAAHADSPLPESTFIARYITQEGFSKYMWQVYTVPGTLEEVNSRFFADLLINNGRLVLPDSASIDVINRFWRFAWNLTQDSGFDASHLRYAESTVYRTSEHVRAPKGITLPSNSLILETQTCFFTY